MASGVPLLEALRIAGKVLSNLVLREDSEAVAESVAFDVLEYEIPGALVFLHAVDARDIGVIELGQAFGLAFEPLQPRGILGKQLGQRLDRHVPLEARIAGEVHHAHAAAAQLTLDFVGAYLV